MADYLTDEEQAERIKQWWRDNGVSIAVTIVLGVAAVMGWQQWQRYSHEQAAGASAVYERMTSALSQASQTPGGGDTARAEEAARTLLDEHGKTAYAGFARLALARLAVEDGDYEQAVQQLEAVLERPATDALEHTARLRLARVELERERYERVAELVDAGFPEAWQGAALELKGDMLRARDDPEGAREAYTSALDSLEAGEAGRRRVEMKLNDLAPTS